MVVPAVPEGRYVDAGEGVRIHYHDAGEAKNGTVLFVHGSGPGASGYSNFKGNTPYFNLRGYRTLVPDLYGYGYSSKPTEGSYGLDVLAGHFIALLDALGVEKVSLVGNSMGGAICIRLALDHPERVERLVLMAPGGLEDREVYMAMPGIKAMIENVYAVKGPPTREGIAATFKLQLFDESLITDEILAERLQIAETQPKGIIQRLVVKNQASELENLSMPVLCLWGVDDKFCPVSGAMKVASSVRSSRTILLSRCGHWVMVEHARLFNETAVRFLDGEAS
jgi:4,5:9,10-diseco-3-hydroxy-5,9,17-trioxoandrosta-1(10),2-diene-4-oate hydrolase